MKNQIDQILHRLCNNKWFAKTIDEIKDCDKRMAEMPNYDLMSEDDKKWFRHLSSKKSRLTKEIHEFIDKYERADKMKYIIDNYQSCLERG